MRWWDWLLAETFGDLLDFALPVIVVLLLGLIAVDVIWGTVARRRRRIAQVQDSLHRLGEQTRGHVVEHIDDEEPTADLGDPVRDETPPIPRQRRRP